MLINESLYAHKHVYKYVYLFGGEKSLSHNRKRLEEELTGIRVCSEHGF